MAGSRIVYVLDAWDQDDEASTTEVYDTREKAVKAMARYFDRSGPHVVYAGVVKRIVR